MARRLNKKKLAEVELKSQGVNQRDFVDPSTAVVLGAIGWFSFKAVAQAIIGWLGLKMFVKWQNRGKSGDGNITEISTEESAASS